ncbi:hypothetical protein CONLIGDRAFT_304832 [Coniochaeta ligniaria NRRL 30616]|uniref:Uncharacterized protein n=1 Tax=Coniochaeta ligniaria NRRL 30616 TaxID=1408157 RepID=A0A1J7JMT1_9PEZI|nr:hypothetical protein CONLIGDRAFT_304832 [Coniochaeta ligniaria NRRL 30616]
MDSLRLIEEYFPLETRSPRGGGGKSGGSSKSSGSKGGKGKSGSGSSSSGGSSSKSGSGSSSSGGGTTVVVVGGGSSYNNYHGGSGYIGSLPTWAVVLIIWASLILTLFLCALLYYCLKERKRSKKEGHSPRIKHALWNAVKVAFFIWLAIKIWKCCCGRSRHKKNGTKSGTYAKIDEDGQQGGGAWYGASTTPAVTDTPTAYGAGGAGYAPAESKYEPMGYTGASIAPSPLNSPVPAIAGIPAVAPSTFGALASPPPYSSSTTATATTSTSPHATTTSTGGEAQSYYASMGMSAAYAPSISSTYEPSVLSSAPTPVPAYQAAYHPPVSPVTTEYPAYPPQATYVPHTSPGPRYGGS